MVASTPWVGKRPDRAEAMRPGSNVDSEIFREFQMLFRTSRPSPEHSDCHRAGRVPAAESKESIA